MPTPEQLERAREKALESPRIGKRGKGKKTLDKEERRRIFNEIVSEEFEELIRAAKPEYKLDQFIGKAGDLLDITTKGESVNTSDITALAEQAAKLLKEKKV